MRTVGRAGMLALAVCVAPGAALACKGKTQLYRDTFQEVNPAWAESEDFRIGGGTARMSVDPAKGWTITLGGAVFDDADACVDVALPGAAPNQALAGLAFWAEDAGDFYALVVRPSGSAAISRLQNGKFSHPVDWRKFAGIATRPGAVNHLRVTFKGNSAAAYINDQPFATITGQHPVDGGTIGLHAEAEPNRGATWLFSNLRVTDF